MPISTIKSVINQKSTIMRKIKLLFASLILMTFSLPFTTNAQVEVTDAPAYLNFTLTEGGAKYNILQIDTETRVKMTPSGNCQVKTEFVLPLALKALIPSGGSVELPCYRFAVWVDTQVDYTHFEAYNVKIKIESSGVASVVCNWTAADSDY